MLAILPSWTGTKNTKGVMYTRNIYNQKKSV